MVLPIDHSKRSRTTQIEILRAFVERVREVDGLNDQNAVLCDQSQPKDAPSGGKLLVTVSPGSGKFKIGSSSHHACATEEMLLNVSIFAVNMRDKPGRSESKLLDDDSFSQFKARILSKLLVESPELKASSPAWEPTRISGQFRIPLLREPAIPLDCSGPFDCWKNWCGIQLLWLVTFDWDLYSS